MDSLTKKTVVTGRGFTYTYYVSPAAEGKPTLLLLHGFPDCAAEWEDFITQHLRPAGYGAIAPDMLGYGGTSKPDDPAQYKASGIAADLADILDAEGLDRVISFGHDWGSRAAQALHNQRPGRVAGLAMVNVGYIPTATGPFDLDAVLVQTEKAFGMGIWYWKFFTAEDGARLLRANADVVFDALHAPQSWAELLCAEGATRRAIEGRGAGFDLARRPYATEEMKRVFVARMQRDGFEGPTCWYKCTVFGHQDGDSRPENNVVDVPTLFVGYRDDVLCRPEAMAPSIQAGLLPQLTSVMLDGAHWGHVENPKAFGETVVGWLSKNY